VGNFHRSRVVRQGLVSISSASQLFMGFVRLLDVVKQCSLLWPMPVRCGSARLSAGGAVWRGGARRIGSMAFSAGPGFCSFHSS